MAQIVADHDTATSRGATSRELSRDAAVEGCSRPGGLTAAVEALGLVMTPQRRLLLQLIEEAPEPFDFEDILSRLRQEKPHGTRVIVYRTLNQLAQAGLLIPVGVRERRRCYVRAGAGPILQVHDMHTGMQVTLEAPDLIEAITRFIEGQGYRMGKRIEVQVRATRVVKQSKAR